MNQSDNSKRSSPVQPNILQAATTICFLVAAFLALVIIGLDIVKSHGDVGKRDFIVYWTAGQLLLHGGNPYDPIAALQLEHSAGYALPFALICSSPPLVFFLLVPLGLVDARLGGDLWLIFLTICLLISLRVFYVTLRRPLDRYCLLGFGFAPVLACLMAGQIGIILLLGIALFLRFRNSRPFLAGIALLPCLLKPHLFLAFGVALILWVASRRQYRLLAGFGAGLLAAGGLAAVLDFHAWSQWLQWLHTWDAVNRFQPTLSKMFRDLVYREGAWLQFLPAFVSCAWAAWYFRSRETHWDWMDHGQLLLIVSIGCAPYAWLTDESVLLPAIIVAVYRALESGRSLLPLGLILTIALAELFRGNWMLTSYYLWTVPAWMAFYLYATRRGPKFSSAAPAFGGTV